VNTTADNAAMLYFGMSLTCHSGGAAHIP